MQTERGPECFECIWLALATVAGLHLPGFWLRLGPWLPRYFRSLSLSLGVPGILFSPLPTTCSPTKPQAPALICVQKKCVLLERAGRTLSSHYLALKGDYYVFCGWQREKEGKIPPPGSNNVPFSWRS